MMKILNLNLAILLGKQNTKKKKKKKKNAKGYIPNWSEEVFVIIKVISDVKGSEIVGKLYEKELQKKPNK